MNEVALASDLGAAVMKIRRRLVKEGDPANHLTMNAMAALGALALNGDLRIGDLASHEGVRPPSMTRIVNALERQGLVKRGPNTSDRRQVVVSLTEQGRATLRRDRRRRDEWLARQLRDLDPADLEMLAQAAPLLQRISTIG